jgi:iron complex outermembrane receptor protein
MCVFKKNKRKKRILKTVFLGAILLLGILSRASADPDTSSASPSTINDLTQMSLENLSGLNVVVTSSAKEEESLRNATSAIFVITQEDIQNSGLQHVADLLRVVPGLLVSRVNANEWAVTARGFNSEFNNKMLVLVDGRSVYQSKFGGVNWNELDTLLEDIDRIEVIRGPGGTLWGENAVNGVINIITKDSKITQGVYATSLTGSNGDNMAALHYGGKIGDDLYYRIYGQTENWGAFQTMTGQNAQDNWMAQRAGFRTDLHGEKDTLTVEGEYQVGNFDNPQNDFNALTLQNSGSYQNDTVDRDDHLLAHWLHTFADGSEGSLTAYYDQVNLQPTNTVNSALNTLDAEFQYRFHLNEWNEVTWGGDFRNVTDDYDNAITSFYFPVDASLNTYGVFLNDKVTLVDNRLYLTGGVKWENNSYTGNEWEPSGRVLFTPDSNNSLWAAVSRNVRVPSRVEENVSYFLQGFAAGPTTFYAGISGNANLTAEDIVSYEIGYRTNLTSSISLDLAGFYNRYYNVITADLIQYAPGTGPATPIGGSYVSEVLASNADGGSIYGTEISLKWDITNSLKSAFAYTYNGYDATMNAVSNIFVGNPPPHNILDGRLSWDATSNLRLNTSYYWVDATVINDPTGVNTGIVPPYGVWDLGFIWKATPNWEVSVWGQDLEGAHAEAASFLNSSSPQTGIYGQLTARY